MIQNFFDVLIPSAHACVGCGQQSSFTPKILLIGSGFVLLPVALAGFIAWRLWKDHKHLNPPK